MTLSKEIFFCILKLCMTFLWIWSRDICENIVPSFGLQDPRNGVWVTVRKIIFLFSANSWLALGSTCPFSGRHRRIFFPEDEMGGTERRLFTQSLDSVVIYLYFSLCLHGEVIADSQSFFSQYCLGISTLEFSLLIFFHLRSTDR
jgi:hypothetical protein